MKTEAECQAILDDYRCPLDGADLEEMGEYDEDGWSVWFECRTPDRHYWRAERAGRDDYRAIAEEAADRFPDQVTP